MCVSASEPYYYETRSWNRGISGMNCSDIVALLVKKGHPKISSIVSEDLIDGECLANNPDEWFDHNTKLSLSQIRKVRKIVAAASDI